MAIVGLGAGTLACYAQAGQRWTFYEIDPAVVRIARDPRYFTYLADCRARGVDPEIIVGDARLRLRDAPRSWLSAHRARRLQLRRAARFTCSRARRSDCTIPSWPPGGLLAINLSNRYLDLDPVMARQAADAGLVCRIRHDVNVEEAE